jgi:hypothetical protein
MIAKSEMVRVGRSNACVRLWIHHETGGKKMTIDLESGNIALQDENGNFINECNMSEIIERMMGDERRVQSEFKKTKSFDE